MEHAKKGRCRPRLLQTQKRAFFVFFESKQFRMVFAQNGLDIFRLAVSPLDPDHFRRVSIEEAALVKISVLRHDGQAVLGGIIPDGLIISSVQVDLSYMDRFRVQICNCLHQVGREVLVKQKFHFREADTSFRSRSAAKARQARISSLFRSGKSLRISSSDIPEAR